MDPFEIRNPSLLDHFQKDAEMTEIATGFSFTEGPIWHTKEHWLMFSDIQKSQQFKWQGAARFGQRLWATDPGCPTA